MKRLKEAYVKLLFSKFEPSVDTKTVGPMMEELINKLPTKFMQGVSYLKTRQYGRWAEAKHQKGTDVDQGAAQLLLEAATQNVQQGTTNQSAGCSNSVDVIEGTSTIGSNTTVNANKVEVNINMPSTMPSEFPGVEDRDLFKLNKYFISCFLLNLPA
jgi:hypothetical protein